MTINDKISQLQQVIESQLLPLIDNDYYLLDVPYYFNIGDVLIWQGTLDFLKKTTFKCLGYHSYQTFQFPKINKNIVILLMGGGNFGDVYPECHSLRKKIIEAYPDNKIIMLPQTVYYSGVRSIRYDSSLYRKHKNLVLCARDINSYNFLRHFHFSDQIMLIPDMAFFADATVNSISIKNQKKRVLIFKRLDKESSDMREIQEMVNDTDYDISDWCMDDNIKSIYKTLNSCIEHNDFERADYVAYHDYLSSSIQAGVDLISQYKEVYSNRLHGAILSMLLSKKITFVDNSYGKNVHFYDTWLNDTEYISVHRIVHPISFKRLIQQHIVYLLTLYDRVFNGSSHK